MSLIIAGSLPPLEEAQYVTPPTQAPAQAPPQATMSAPVTAFTPLNLGRSVFEQIINALADLARKDQRIGQMFKGGQALENGVIITTPEGVITMIIVGNRPVIYYRLNYANQLLNKLRDLYIQLRNKIASGLAREPDIALYYLLDLLYQNYTPLGEIVLSPELMKTVSAVSAMLPHFEIGEAYAPYIVKIGTAFSRVLPIYEALLNLLYKNARIY